MQAGDAESARSRRTHTHNHTHTHTHTQACDAGERQEQAKEAMLQRVEVESKRVGGEDANRVVLKGIIGKGGAGCVYVCVCV